MRLNTSAITIRRSTAISISSAGAARASPLLKGGPRNGPGLRAWDATPFDGARLNRGCRLASALAQHHLGSVSVNVLPTPGVLRTRISPPMPRARLRLIASPRPVPPLELVKLLT